MIIMATILSPIDTYCIFFFIYFLVACCRCSVPRCIASRRDLNNCNRQLSSARNMLQSSFHLYSSEESVSHNIFEMSEYSQLQISRLRRLIRTAVENQINNSNYPSLISGRRNSF